MDGDYQTLIKCLLAILVAPVSALLMVYASLSLGLAVYTWIALTLMVTPLVIFWYRIEWQRIRSYWDLLMHSVYDVDFERALAEYIDLIEKQKKS